MSRRRLAALVAATATLTLIPPSISEATEAAGAAALVSSTVQAARCAQAMHDAVVQDNVSYNARDEEAYMEVIHPDIIFHVAGTTTYGIDAHMESVRAAWANPEPWEWQWEILSETMFGCHTGIAVVDIHIVYPNRIRQFSVTMTMVKERGRWQVAMDTAYFVGETPTG
jgi:SnoaL-like domain